MSRTITFSTIFLLAIILAIITKKFLVEVFIVPSDSMKTYMKNGDFIVIRKNNYFLENKLFKDEVIVFYNPQLGDTLKKTDKKYLTKRCITEPGDTLKIIKGYICINNHDINDVSTILELYEIEYDEKFDFEKLNYLIDLEGYIKPCKKNQLLLKKENELKINRMIGIASIKKAFCSKYNPSIFPQDSTFQWNEDNFGPLYIPKKGRTIELTKNNLILYRSIIEGFEKNELKTEDDRVYINGKQTETYTFKQNYYFMMGDNRPFSIDSRYFGFVPENHIIGKVILVI